MSKMKDLLFDICDDYKSSMALQDISAKYDMSVTQILKIVHDFGYGYYPAVVKDEPLEYYED